MPKLTKRTNPYGADVRSNVQSQDPNSLAFKIYYYFSGCEDVNDESFEPKVRHTPSKPIKEVWQTIEETNVNNTSTDVLVGMDLEGDQTRYCQTINYVLRRYVVQ